MSEVLRFGSGGAFDEEMAKSHRTALARLMKDRAEIDLLIDRVSRDVAEDERRRDESAGERFRVLTADPAWGFADKLPGAGRGAAKHYDTNVAERILTQPLPPLTDDAVLFLWRVAAGDADLDRALAELAYRVLRAWGFVPKTEIVWFKRSTCSRCKGEGRVNARKYVEQATIPLSGAPERVYDGKMRATCRECDGKGEKDGFGMGRIVRGSHEVCLVGVRGRAIDHVLSHSVRSAFETVENSEIVAPTGAHSEKPEAFYRLVETLFPGPYFELHARRPRPGWTSAGHQLENAEPTAS